MKAFIHTYKEVNILDITLRANGSCRRGDPWVYHKKEVINKMACYYPFGTNTISQLYEMTSNNSIMPGCKLFIAPECKTGRDTFRNSGYKITRDKDKADVIVVPDVKASMFFNYHCNMVAKDEDTDKLYIIELHKSGYDNPIIDKEDIERASEYVESAIGLKVDDSQMTDFYVWFIPKCDEIKNVLTENMLNVPYVQESRIPVSASTSFTAETLIFWENIDDPNLLMRTICTSDWMDYPVTLLAFLTITQNKLDNRNWFNYANGDFRRILQNIGYSAYSDFRYQVRYHSLSPKDFNMLQAYLYMKLGLGPEGGIINQKTLASLDSDFHPYLQRKIALKPLQIPTKMNEETIRNIVTG